jgi:hypothetical protein
VRRGGKGILIDRGSKKRSQSSLAKVGIDLDEIESNGLDVKMGSKKQLQIEKLREENAELKARIKQMAKTKGAYFDGQKSQSPLATFSPLKEAASEALIYA